MFIAVKNFGEGPVNCALEAGSIPPLVPCTCIKGVELSRAGVAQDDFDSQYMINRHPKKNGMCTG